METSKKEQDPGIDEPNGKDDFLISEKTEDVDASGVDDTSTGMGDDDYLGKTNRKSGKDE